jgi:hypothetical protein
MPGLMVRQRNLRLWRQLPSPDVDYCDDASGRTETPMVIRRKASAGPK